MSLLFDKNGNLIHEVVNKRIKHSERTKSEIKEIEMLGGSKLQVDKYFCSKCQTFHKKKFGGKLNQTFIKHSSYGIEVSSTYVFNLKLMKSMRNYDIKKYKLTKGSKKQ